MPRVKSQVIKTPTEKNGKKHANRNRAEKITGDYPYDYDFKTNHDFRENSPEKERSPEKQKPSFPNLNEIPNRRGRQAARSAFFNKKGLKT